jgi:hypothetical protein
MSDLWSFVRDRWYWVVGALLGLWLVYLLLRRRSASVHDSSSQGAVTQYATDPNILAANASAQAAAIQAQSQRQATATAAAAQIEIAKLQLQQQQDIDTANVNMANSGYSAALAIQQSNNQSAASIAQTQANSALGIAQIQGNTAIAQIGGQVAMNQAQMDAAVAQAKYNDDASVAIQNGINWANVQQTLSNNQTALGAYAIQGQVANNAITTAGNVDLASTAAQQAEMEQYYQLAGALSAQQLQNEQDRFNSAASIIASGQLNKGGEGGMVQQTAFAALLGSPAAVPSAWGAGQVGVTQAEQTASIVNSVMSGLASVAGGPIGVGVGKAIG